MSRRVCIRVWVRLLCSREDGGVTLETVLILPLLLFAYIGTFVFFHAFRADATNVKTTYAVADILSRETTEPVTPAYLDRLFELQGTLSATWHPRTLRVTTLRFDAAEDRYRLVWSQARGGLPGLTEADLSDMRNAHLPTMTDGEVGILVETTRDYTPPLAGSGIRPFRIQDVMIVRPRFAPTLCWSDIDLGPWAREDQVC